MKSGIYAIINTKTNKHYIGSAINFEERWKRHFKDLDNGNHHSIKLQRSLIISMGKMLSYVKS